MATVFFRTLIIYLILFITLRLMGKRQVGELQISELVTTFMLSEFAVIPMQNTQIPISYAVIPILLLLSLEVINAFLLTKSVKLRKIFCGKPSVIINKGKLVQSELKRLRININELISELRQKDIADISDVEYAIIEENGKLSVFPKADKLSVTPSDLKLTVPERGIAHAVVIDGCISESNLSLAGRDRIWLEKYLISADIPLKDVFLMTIDGCSKTIIYKKEVAEK